MLQGPENDYGDYDYLIEELPHDYAKWEFSRFTSRCDNCGKERHLLLRSAHYFHTLDGYDYMSYDECLVCRLESKMYSVKYRIKKRIKKEIKVVRDAWRLTNVSSAGNFRYYYKLIKEISR